MTDPIVPVILSGGSGTRLWPVSSEAKPKQLHALTGDATMLQATAGRVLDATRFARPIVVSSERHADEVEAQLTAVGVEPSALILEPTGRNTAAAIALAALEAEPSALLLVMPSDHVIGRPDLFLSSVDRAAPFARQGYIVTFGITPHFPETGYGYIQRGDPLGDEVFLVARFVEKPARSTADEFLRAGTYCWNGGIFLFEAGRIIAALEAHAPDILVSVRQSLDNADRHGTRVHPWPDQFTRTRSQSIDHAVLEVDDRVAVARVQMDWSDVGSWDAIYDLLGKDDAGNQVAGQAIAIDTRRCLLRSGGPIIVTVGIEDLIVVATADGILIMPRGQSQRIKEATALIGSSAKLAPPEECRAMRAVLKGTVLDGEPPVHATVTRGRVRSLAERRAVKPSVDQANTLSYLEVMKLLLFVGTLAFALCSNAASAQLISERVENGQRICAYYGSDRNPQDELVARTRTVGFGENCPAVAYPRDLTAPPPPNAQLIEEANGGSGRVCVFSQGSQQYRLSIPFSSRCAMTPAQQGQASR